MSQPPAIWLRWERRARQFEREGKLALATVSGAARADVNAAQRLNHNMRSPLHALAAGEYAARTGAMSLPDFFKLVRDSVDQINAQLKGDD